MEVDDKNREPWCVEPFTTIESKVWGAWGLCCRSKPLPYSAVTHSPLEHFNSDTMKRIRVDMKNHNVTDEIKHLCEKCLLHEQQGSDSRRQLMQGTKVPYMYPDGKINMPYRFKALEIKFFGNLCNLKCRMCGPLYSSKWAAENKLKGEWSGPTHLDVWQSYPAERKLTFFDDMKKILPFTDRVKFTGGEPMMNDSILEFIEWMVTTGLSRRLTLHIITNGTVANKDLLRFGRHFKQFSIVVSIDGVFDVDEYQRTGTDWNVVDENMNTFKQYGSVSITTAVSALNISSIYEIQAYAALLDVHHDTSSIVLTPAHLQVKVLPPQYRKKLVEKWSYPNHLKKTLLNSEWPVDLWNEFVDKEFKAIEFIDGLESYL